MKTSSLSLHLHCSGAYGSLDSPSTRAMSSSRKIYIYIYMPITPFGGPFLVSRCQEIEGDVKNQGEKKTKKQKTTTC